MRILFLEWKSIGNEYVIKEFEKLGVKVVRMDMTKQGIDTRRDENFAAQIAKTILSEQADAVFSFNYFVTAAIACNACKVKYISWTYDSPFSQLYSKTITLPTNIPFTFDKEECIKLHKLGAENVQYLPLCAPVEYYDSLNNSKEMADKFTADVSFVGSMYTEEKNNLFRHIEKADDYTLGYIDGLFAMQKNIYGASILEKALTKEIVERIHKVAPIYASGDGMESDEWIIANYYLARKLTSIERTEMIDLLKAGIGDVKVFGHVDYYNEAPFVMKNSQINLNISLRSIVNAIPLRIFDIMGNGGFALTDYRGEMEEYFVAGEDYDYFDSKESLVDKCRYYLSHEDERKDLAKSGYDKVKKYHTYRNRVETIMEYL